MSKTVSKPRFIYDDFAKMDFFTAALDLAGYCLRLNGKPDNRQAAVDYLSAICQKHKDRRLAERKELK